MRSPKSPNIHALEGMASLIGQYEAFIFDQWGVLHDGFTAYPNAVEILHTIKKQGKKIFVLSNSGKLAASNLAVLEHVGFAPYLFDGIVTSGEAILAAIAHKRWDFLSQPVFPINTAERFDFWDATGLTPTNDLANAVWVLLSSVNHEFSFEDYTRLLKPATDLRLPLLCINPDQYAITQGGRLFFGPGNLAKWYEEQRCSVYYLGKPYPEVYALCKEKLGFILPEKTLCIGDSLEHDILGANQNGFPSLLLGQGVIHQRLAGHPQPLAKVYELCLEAGATPTFYSFGL